MGQPAVELDQLERHFGSVRAVDGVSLSVEDGEFFSMLGPSGSGKTTCLRLVAGFDRPTSGRISLFGASVENVPPYNRAVNTVFQDYALFPHMTVAQNVGYGLKIQGRPKREIAQRVEAMLGLVQLPHVGDRRPHQLSGGQKQRVSLARALVNEPKVLLLDEPPGALDLKLRQAMQVELKALQKKLGITFLYVTHDQEEALGMSDRLAIFRAGKVEQVGTPQEVYDQPATAFVAEFVGLSNRLEGAIAERTLGSPGPFVLRPEKIRVGKDAPPEGQRALSGEIRQVLFLGSIEKLLVDVDGGSLQVVVPAGSALDLQPGERVQLGFRPEDARLVRG